MVVTVCTVWCHVQGFREDRDAGSHVDIMHGVARHELEDLLARVEQSNAHDQVISVMCTPVCVLSTRRYYSAKTFARIVQLRYVCMLYVVWVCYVVRV